MPSLNDGQREFFDWQAAFAEEQLPEDDEAPEGPIAASPEPGAPGAEPEQPDGPEHTAAPAQTTLADPKHFAHRLFADYARGLPRPSGSHGAYYKGRPRSYEPYEPSAYEDVEFYEQDSDDQHSE
jgi:hypothetical protein